LRRRIVDKDARENYAELLHRLDHLLLSEASNVPPYRGTLRQLEAGEPVVAQGWEFGYGNDWSPYCLESDGRVTPVEPVYVDPDARPLHVKDYRRPDGSRVRSGANEPT
jgi:hypothetical protein